MRGVVRAWMALGLSWSMSVGGGAAASLFAQAPIPAAALSAHTVAIENLTHNDAVGQGAEAALRDWGKLQVVGDPDTADLTLRFEKSTAHDGESTQKPGSDGGSSSYSYSLSFSSKITMHAYLKNGEASFYSTTTDDSKRKAGVSCVNSMREAFRAAQAPAH